MNATELAVNRRNTAAFIDADPHELVLTPRTKVKTGTGGTTWNKGRPRPPQRFKIIENVSNRMADGRVVGGTQAEEEYTLLGNWDAIIGEHDIFEYRGSQWEVISLLWFNGYERRARVRQYG